MREMLGISKGGFYFMILFSLRAYEKENRSSYTPFSSPHTPFPCSAPPGVNPAKIVISRKKSSQNIGTSRSKLLRPSLSKSRSRAKNAQKDVFSPLKTPLICIGTPLALPPVPFTLCSPAHPCILYSFFLTLIFRSPSMPLLWLLFLYIFAFFVSLSWVPLFVSLFPAPVLLELHLLVSLPPWICFFVFKHRWFTASKVFIVGFSCCSLHVEST